MKRSVPPSLLVCLLTLAGAAVRAHRLGAESFWYDETVSAFLAGSPLPELLRHTAGDIHPPGYYLVLRGWLMLLGYPDGRAGPAGNGLEFAAAYFSFGLGLLLIPLVYALARRLAGRRAALVSAGLVALSPFNVWYSQEVRMYTLGAGLGVLAIYALWRAANTPAGPASRRQLAGWLAAYAVAAAAGMYTLYYFVFLLIPINAWMVGQCLVFHRGARPSLPRGQALPILLANLAAAALYAPWIPVAWRQATDPPVPPWRAAPDLWAALTEGWNALSLGQSAPAWVRPVLWITLGLCVLGVLALMRSGRRGGQTSLLLIAAFGPAALILLVSFSVTPLYHVRYLFTYSPAFYILSGAGLALLLEPCHARVSGAALTAARGAAGVLAALAWIAGAGVTLDAYWSDPAYEADDHRSAVAELQARWRPGDVVVVNAGWAYTALATYWSGAISHSGRLTSELPERREDANLVMVVTGHVGGDPGLGWGDPRSDFYAMPANTARDRIGSLFERFDRVWHYRIYDTVSDPGGLLRALLEQEGQLADDRMYAGEAYLRVQAYAPRRQATWSEELPVAVYTAGLSVQPQPTRAVAESGSTIYSALTWRADAVPAAFATSVRLVDAVGSRWAQPPDEQPLGPMLPADQWRPGQILRQPIALEVPAGTPPGLYAVELIVYEAATGRVWQPLPRSSSLSTDGESLLIGQVEITRPADSGPLRPPLARFGPVSLLEAGSPATIIAPGDTVPVDVLWQAVSAPGEPLITVLQLLDSSNSVAAGLEAQPVDGRYPTQAWTSGELVRDHYALRLPQDLAAGTYRLILGVYRSSDGERLLTRGRLFGRSDHWVVQKITVQ